MLSRSRPRTNLDAWKGKLSTEVWNQLARARGAHINSLEVFPLFAAAMVCGIAIEMSTWIASDKEQVAGNVAKLPAEDLNSVALSFFAARTLYLGLYMGVKSDTLAYARTGVYFWSISIPIIALWKAGKALQGEV